MTASEIFRVGGMLILLVGFVLGLAMVRSRMKGPHAPRYLIMTHLAAVIQGTLLLVLSLVVRDSDLSSGLAKVAAVAFFAGCLFFVTGAIANWIQGVADSFAERSLGYNMSALGSLGIFGGAAIMTIGVFRGL